MLTAHFKKWLNNDMTTIWTSPTIIDQYAESGAELVHIPWNNSQFDAVISPDSTSLGTQGVLTHISKSPRVDETNKTYFLSANGYNFNDLPNIVSGITLRLTTNRYGRISDDTIQIIVNGEPAGENLASKSVDPIKIYGGVNDLWGIDNLSVSDLQNSNFGVLIRFKSHPHYPHKDGANIYAIELQIH